MARRSSHWRAGGVPPAWRDLVLIVLILLAVDAIAAWLLVYVYFPARRDEALARTPPQLSLLAIDRQHALSGWVRERLSDAELTASLLGPAGGNGTAPALLDHFIRAYRYSSAFVIDDTGALVQRRGNADADLASIVAFVRASPKVPGAWIDFRRIGNKPRILTACRFDGGTLVFVSDPYDYIYPLLSTFAIASKSGETNLIGLYGDMGLALNPYPGDPTPPMTVRRQIPRAHAAQVLATGERSIRMTDRRGVPVIGVVKAIPRTPWVVFAKIDQEEVLAVAVDETVRLGQLFGFVSVMLAMIAFIILRSRRMRTLRAAEDQLARLYANTTSGVLVLRVVFDEHGRPVDHQLADMNPAAATLFGVTASEEIGKRSADARYLQWPEEIRARNYEIALTGTPAHYEQYDAVSERWYDTRCFSPRRGQFAQLLTDVTERRKSEETVRQLSARLLRVQDDTRRRIARDLHETVAQSLAGLRMNLGMIKGLTGGAEIVDDSISIADDALTEVRTMSYLLHPPMIDQAGLVTALRWYIDGFQQRSGITTTLEAPDDLGRLPRDVETSVFRIVQECLTNVQRHSGSATARVSVERSGDRLSVEIADRGRGLRPALRADRDALLASGVGVAGINERVHELRGELVIHSTEQGTTMRVMLPVARSSPVPAPSLTS
ncbi:MAG: ATP-binding protein [Thermoanaerobaculia bacterium]